MMASAASFSASAASWAAVEGAATPIVFQVVVEVVVVDFLDLDLRAVDPTELMSVYYI